MGYDLHTHSLHSDGRSSAIDLARMAWAGGLTGLAVTDHDTVDHFDEARQACAVFGLDWIPGLELSTERGTTSVHLLGLWVEPDDRGLRHELRRLRGERERRARVMVDRLRGFGAALTWQDVAARAGSAPVGRPHLAAAMVQAGVVPTPGRAFSDWIGENGPAYEPKRALDPVAGVALIRAAGGVAVLAHPSWGGVDMPLLDALVTAGLGGLEAGRGYDPEETDRYWHRAAAVRDLLVVTGTDFHGAPQSLTIGDRTTPEALVEGLRARVGREVSRW